MTSRLRGSIYRGWTPGDVNRAGVIVSRNARNTTWDSVLVATILEDRTLEAAFQALPTAIRLEDAEPVVGLVLLDFLDLIPIADLQTYVGSLSNATLQKIDRALPSVFTP